MKMYINMLNGIPEKYIEELSKRLKKSTIIDKLLITLYFMSEMNDEYHELKNIEINLRKIARDSNYSDFQASAIRGPFNRETQNVKSGKIKECDRLWIKVGNGKWRNSYIANSEAEKILWKNGIEVIKNSFTNMNSLKSKEIIELTGEERQALIKVRVNQGIYREKLIKKEPRCKVCGMDNVKLLIASHAKPWSECIPNEKLDENNGFLLCPNHDSLFDKFFISFDDEGQILISSMLSEDDMDKLKVDNDIKININNKEREYIKYHRNKFLENESNILNKNNKMLRRIE